MKVCVVTPFYSEESIMSRPYYILRTLKSVENVKVTLITSDFSHQKKGKTNFQFGELVWTIPYKKNVSLMRFFSHFILSISLAIRAIRLKNEVDIYYVTAPFAVSIPIIKFFTNKKVISDIVDFWPDSLPLSKYSFLKPLFLLWRACNKFSILQSDKIISLSSVFLNCVGVHKKNQILLGATSSFIRSFDLKKNEISIAYIGNVGELYDFETLISSLQHMSSSVFIKLHIVGEGDRLPWLISELNKKGINFVHYGPIYSDNELTSILSKVHVGFNGYRDTNASFSYKSVTYFKFGLPIINSMSGDMFDFVEDYKIGVNYISGDVDSLIIALKHFSCNELDFYHSNVRCFFEQNLDDDVVRSKLINVFEELGNEKTCF